MSDRKIATFLSSGIDSTFLTSIIDKKLDYKLNTFTYDFKNNFNYGESYIVNKNLKKLNVSNHMFLLDKDMTYRLMP